MRELILWAFAALLILTWVDAAHAEKRVALVIGNSGYKHVTRLTNPKNDATVLAQRFRELGFDKVTLKLDLDANVLRRTLGQFSRDSAGADTAVIYFAGHGIEVDGMNYVIPTDAKLSHVDDVDFEAVELNKLMRSLNRAKKLKLVILDACRNDPFKNNMAGIGGSRSVGRGLARVSLTGSDTLVAYAAREGTVAADGDDKHSPYAQALIKHITTPDLDIRLLFGRVRDDVLAATGRKQEPFTYGSLPGRPIFLASKGTNGTSREQTTTAVPQIDREALFWSSVEDSEDPSEIRAYLERFPNGTFAGLARRRLSKLESKLAARTPAQPEKPLKAPRQAGGAEMTAKDAHTAYKLAEDYSWARGVKQDYKKAFKYYLQAAQAGHPEAQFTVAMAYDAGRGVNRNTLEGLVWLHMVAEFNERTGAKLRQRAKYQIQLLEPVLLSVGVLSIQQIKAARKRAEELSKPKG